MTALSQQTRLKAERAVLLLFQIPWTKSAYLKLPPLRALQGARSLMICPQCDSEMSKKWNPSSVKTLAGAAVVWECGVCGCKLTQADMKVMAKHPGNLEVQLPPTTAV